MIGGIGNEFLNERIAIFNDDTRDVIKGSVFYKEKPGFVKAPWCGCRECEDKIKEDTGATTRCIPFAGGEVGKMEEAILDSYGLTKADFEVPKMPRLGSHGLRRAMRFQVWDASAKATDDGVMCEFSIDKGSYATAVLREVMKKDVY